MESEVSLLSEINDLIRRIALNAVDSQNPMEVVSGTITSLAPLKIQFDEKRILDEDFLTLTQTAKHRIELEEHPGGQVIAIKNQGGQEYIVLDKVVE